MGSVNRDRIELLRAAMKREGIDAYMIPTADFHNSEYAAGHFPDDYHYAGRGTDAGTEGGELEKSCRPSGDDVHFLERPYD